MIFISFFSFLLFFFILFYSVLHEETIAYLGMGGSCENKKMKLVRAVTWGGMALEVRHFLEALWKSLERMIRCEEHVNMRTCTPCLRMSDSWSSSDFWCWYKKEPPHRQRDFLDVLLKKQILYWKRQIHNCWCSAPPLKLNGSPIDFITSGVVRRTISICFQNRKPILLHISTATVKCWRRERV